MHKPKAFYLYLMLLLMAIIFSSQLFIQCSSIKNLQKVSGRITSKDINETSFAGGRRGVKGRPFNAVLITLDNKKRYTIALNDNNWGIAYKLSPGDLVSIYYLPKIIGWLSLDFLIYEERVSQVEENNNVVILFEQQKKDDLPILGIIGIAILATVYQLLKQRARKAN